MAVPIIICQVLHFPERFVKENGLKVSFSHWMVQSELTYSRRSFWCSVVASSPFNSLLTAGWTRAGATMHRFNHIGNILSYLFLATEGRDCLFTVSFDFNLQYFPRQWLKVKRVRVLKFSYDKLLKLCLPTLTSDKNTFRPNRLLEGANGKKYDIWKSSPLGSGKPFSIIQDHC